MALASARAAAAFVAPQIGRRQSVKPAGAAGNAGVAAIKEERRALAAAVQAGGEQPRRQRAAPRRRRLVARAATGNGAAVRVTFSVPSCKLAFGENLRVCGSAPELGAWDATQAPALTWSEGDNWAADLYLPPGAPIAFKLVIVRSDGSQQWEEGGDRRLDLQWGTAARATCPRFNDTGSTQVEADGAGGANLQPVQEAASAAAARVEELRRGVADLTRRKQQLAARLAGLEQAVQQRPGSRGQSYRPPASDEEQLRTGWLFSSSDEDDLPAARAGEPARASPTARSLLVPLALLPILLPLCAGSLYFGTKGLDGKQLEAVLPKAASLQAMLPKKADLGGLGGLISKPAPAPAPAAKSSAGGSSSSTPFGSGGGSGGSGLQLPGGLQLPTFSLRF